jgi:MFS family permease
MILENRAAVQPFFGQMADIFGRRWLTLFIVSMFTLGSGICGGATNGSMLIAGREIHGIGSRGLIMMIDVIVSDLVPLRERGNFMAMVLSIYSIGTSLDPWVGGAIVDHVSWRWVIVPFVAQEKLTKRMLMLRNWNRHSTSISQFAPSR